MSDNWLISLLGFTGLSILIFIAVELVSKNKSNTIIYPSYRPYPRPRPYHPSTRPIGGCHGTRYGCCADGVTAKKDAVGRNCLLY